MRVGTYLWRDIRVGKFFKLNKSFIFLLVSISCIFILKSDANEEAIKMNSAYFDGNQFHNQYVSLERKWGKFFKWMLNRNKTKWPEWIETVYAPSPIYRQTENTIKITIVNHATALIQFEGLNILTDPIWSKRCSPFTWMGPKRVQNPGIRFKELPPIDVVVISHNHYDHMDLPTLKNLERDHSPRFYVGLKNKTFLESNGLSQVTEFDWWEEDIFNDKLKITYVPAQHFSSRGMFDHNKTLWGGFVFTFGERHIYFAGDTGLSPHFGEIFKKFGEIDVALLPIGAYEPRWFMKVAHMNPEDAVNAHLALHANYSIGIHFGTFQLTDEGIDVPGEELKKAMSQLAIADDHFIVPKFGHVIDISF